MILFRLALLLIFFYVNDSSVNSLFRLHAEAEEEDVVKVEQAILHCERLLYVLLQD